MADRTTASSLATPRAAGLLLLAAALGALAGSRWERRAILDPSRPASPRLAPVVVAGLAPITELSLDARGMVPVREDLRDLFDYAESPEKRAIRLENEKRAKIAAMKRARELAEEAERQAKLLEARLKAEKERPPEPPAVTLRLIGKVGSPKTPLAILATADGEVLSLRPGETVAGIYKLLDIDFETATIGYADALVAAHPGWKDGKTVLRMGER